MSDRARAVALAAGLAALTAFAAPAQASLIGESFQGAYLFPDTATVSTNFGDETVGAGVEFDAGGVLFDFTASQLIITFNTGVQFLDGSFNGLRLIDLGSAGITGLSVVSSDVASFDADNLSLVGGAIFINFTDGGLGLDFALNDQVVIDISQDARVVPAPAPLGLIGAGLVALALRRRS
jgi:hypothetical protein